jgi:PDZ domain-containing secreted protein
MSFLKNLGKSKVKFDFFIKVCYLTNLPNAMEGTSALIQVSRKEKECSTKYSLVTNQTVAWDEVVALSSTFFTEKSPDDSLVPFSSKTYTIKVKVSFFACRSYVTAYASILTNPPHTGSWKQRGKVESRA